VVAISGTAAFPSTRDEPLEWQEALRELPTHTGAQGRSPAATPAEIGGSVSVAIPDMAGMIDDSTVPFFQRRAACHQITGLDDETAPLLAACLKHVATSRDPEAAQGNRENESPRALTGH